MDEIIRRIKNELIKKQMNAKDLATQTGIPYTTLTDTLKGKTKELSIQKAKLISEVLGITLDYLIEGKEGQTETIAAHHEGYDFTQDELDEIEKFKAFILAKRDK